MLVAGHQPNYLPYPGFFDKMASVDLFVIADNTQFVKRGPFGWIHRNRIRTEDDWIWLTVPCITSGRFHQRINEVEIASEENWERTHWKSIEWNYKKAPYFDEYRESFKTMYNKNWNRLHELNESFIDRLRNMLGINVPIKRASELNVRGEGTDYVISICKKTDADTYLSGMHGKDYLSIERFEEEGIDLKFQEYESPIYNQVFNDVFIPNLSVIDLLFNHGPESRSILTGETVVRTPEEVDIKTDDT